MEDYRNIIVDMVMQINNERFLKQIYSLIVLHIRKAGN